jgi:hypothetical protein
MRLLPIPSLLYIDSSITQASLHHLLIQAPSLVPRLLSCPTSYTDIYRIYTRQLPSQKAARFARARTEAALPALTGLGLATLDGSSLNAYVL